MFIRKLPDTMYNNYMNVRVICRSRHCNANYNSNTEWQKPERGCIKLNFDGSSKSKKSSIGGVYRNHEGVFLLGYSERIQKSTSSVAELITAKRGLELALENGFFNVWIEGDAKFVVDFMKLPSRLSLGANKDHVKHVNEINVLLSLLDRFDASHICRRGNKVADKLADLGYGVKMPRIWDEPPNEIVKFLKDDVKGQNG